MHRLTQPLPILALATLGAIVTVMAVPAAEAGGNANLICCENENGTYHPVSENGKAADHCVETWDIPEDENPAQYCDEGPQDLTCYSPSVVNDYNACIYLSGCIWSFPGPQCHDITTIGDE